MDLEQFLEKDILIFLDSKIEIKGVTKRDREEEYGLNTTKDYLKELNHALENDELSKAKKLFDELKNNYSKIPKNSSERKKVYIILEKMYEKIQEYVEIKEGKIEVIKEGSSQIFKEKDLKHKETEKEHASTVINNYRFQNINRGAIPLKFYGDNEFEKKDSAAANDIANMDSGITTTSAPKTKGSGSQGELKLDKEEVTDIPDKIARKKYDDDPDKYIQANISDITDRLLLDFRRKFEEDEYEEDRKISALREEIISKVAEEIQTMFTAEKTQINGMMEKIKQELLDQAYREAMEIISSKDNVISTEKNLNNKIDIDSNSNSIKPIGSEFSEHHEETSKYAEEDGDQRIEELEHDEVVAKNIGEYDPIDSRDVIVVSHDDFESEYQQNKNLVEESPEKIIKKNKYSNDDLKIVYEQAVYNMSDNKYDEAAKLFRKIIESQPNNKAARIRLEECIERNPELSNLEDGISDEYVQTIIHPSGNSEEIDLDLNKYTSYDNHVNLEKEEELMINIEESLNNKMKFGRDKRRGTSNEELQRMYEEGIYVMFQSNYEEAAKIFKDILRIRPENKAAKIRLQECMESIHNA